MTDRALVLGHLAASYDIKEAKCRQQAEIYRKAAENLRRMQLEALKEEPHDRQTT